MDGSGMGGEGIRERQGRKGRKGGWGGKGNEREGTGGAFRLSFSYDIPRPY